MFSSCLFTDKSTIRSSWLLSHNMHMKLNSKHRNLFVILFVIVHVLSFELNLLAVTHLGRADFFPVVSILFNVDAERLSTPVTTQTTELLFKKKEKKEVTQNEDGELQPAASSDRLELPYGSSGRERARS